MPGKALGPAVADLGGGGDPLDDLLPPRGGRRTEPPPAAKQPARPAPARRKPTPAPPVAPRGRLTADIDAEILEAARAAVYWTPGLTLAALVEDALAAEVHRRVKRRGEPFPEREGELTTGRPIGSTAWGAG